MRIRFLLKKGSVLSFIRILLTYVVCANIPPMGIKKLLFLILAVSSAAEARPISYSGGSTLMSHLGEYGDFHTWIMVKSKKNDLLKNWSTFPVLKFFKGNFLIEFGYNDKTEWDSHLMYRF